LAQAQTEAFNIRSRAQENAKRVREEILAQVEQEIQRLRQDSQNELVSERERVVAQLRQITLERTFQKVETDLPGLLNSDIQTRLIDQGISLLDRRLDHAGQ
jgi:F-type H+-transporting ATPase subunit b